MVFVQGLYTTVGPKYRIQVSTKISTAYLGTVAQWEIRDPLKVGSFPVQWFWWRMPLLDGSGLV